MDARGAWHHVGNRCARHRSVFQREEHRALFLEVLGEVAAKHGWEVHAWALVPDRFHLIVRSVRGNLSQCMQLLGSLYTRRLNAFEDWDGPAFRARFASQAVTDESRLRYLVAFLHLSAVRAGVTRRIDEGLDTSHRAHMGLAIAPTWLSTRMVRQQIGSPEQLGAWVRDLQSGSARWPSELDLESGWFEDLDGVGRRFNRNPAPDRRTPALLERLAVLDRVCAVTGASKPQLAVTVRGPGANPPRRFAAWMLARHTTLSRKEIAAHLQMRPRQLEGILHRLRRHGAGDLLEGWLRAWEEHDLS
ncbi:MAG: transposase [Myxococcota bacterium]